MLFAILLLLDTCAALMCNEIWNVVWETVSRGLKSPSFDYKPIYLLYLYIQVGVRHRAMILRPILIILTASNQVILHPTHSLIKDTLQFYCSPPLPTTDRRASELQEGADEYKVLQPSTGWEWNWTKTEYVNNYISAGHKLMILLDCTNLIGTELHPLGNKLDLQGFLPFYISSCSARVPSYPLIWGNLSTHHIIITWLLFSLRRLIIINHKRD